MASSGLDMYAAAWVAAAVGLFIVTSDAMSHDAAAAAVVQICCPNRVSRSPRFHFSRSSHLDCRPGVVMATVNAAVSTWRNEAASYTFIRCWCLIPVPMTSLLLLLLLLLHHLVSLSWPVSGKDECGCKRGEMPCERRRPSEMTWCCYCSCSSRPNCQTEIALLCACTQSPLVYLGLSNLLHHAVPLWRLLHFPSPLLFILSFRLVCDDRHVDLCATNDHFCVDQRRLLRGGEH